MQLLTEELRAQLPKLYSQENIPDPIVHLKFFTPDSNWTWYVTEGEPDGDGKRLQLSFQGRCSRTRQRDSRERRQRSGRSASHCMPSPMLLY